MPSNDQSSTASTPSPTSAKKALSGPAPKAQEEDFGGLGEDGMPLNPTGGDPAVQFISGADPANGDAKVEISEPAGTPNFVGLGKEELMKYANDPFWIRLRWTLFILFWVLWVAMLAGAVIIIVLAPKCSDKKSEPDTYYQVYVKTFAKDGKLEDLKNQAEYLNDLGVKTVIISQVLQTDNGGGIQNVVDFQNVDPLFGTLASFKETVSALKAKGLSVLLQLIPNHSGVEHKWFNDSSTKDFYVRKPEAEVQGSTWKTRIQSNAWNTDPLNASDKYLRLFGDSEADLNYRNDAVIKEMKDVLKFWIDQGVSGFLLSDVSYLVEDLTKLKDASAVKNQPENPDVIKKIIPSEAKIVLLDTEGLEFDSEEFNKYESASPVVSPIVTDLNSKLGPSTTGDAVKNIVEKLENANKTNLVLRLSGPRIDRLEKRVGSRGRANLVAMVAFTMKSKVILYYGEERDDVYDATKIASSGFEKGTEPMKFGKNANFDYFKNLIALQRIINSDANTKTEFNSTGAVLTIKKSTEACKYIVVTNFGATDAMIQFPDFGEASSAKATVMAVTPNVGNLKEKSSITEGKLDLPSDGGAIIKFEN